MCVCVCVYELTASVCGRKVYQDRKQVCTWKHSRKHTHMSTHIFPDSLTHIHIVVTRSHTLIHVYTHTHTHTHTHIDEVLRGIGEGRREKVDQRGKQVGGLEARHAHCHTHTLREPTHTHTYIYTYMQTYSHTRTHAYRETDSF